MPRVVGRTHGVGHFLTREVPLELNTPNPRAGHSSAGGEEKRGGRRQEGGGSTRGGTPAAARTQAPSVICHAYRSTSLIRNRPPPLGPPYDPRYGPTVGSYGGYVFLLNVAEISWKCGNQPCVAHSSAEGGFMAASKASIETISSGRVFLRNTISLGKLEPFLQELG